MNSMNLFFLVIPCLVLMCGVQKKQDPLNAIREPRAVLTKLNTEIEYGFTEGPANDSKGNLYFVDTRNSLIIKHNMAEKTFETWATDTKVANGSMFYKDGPLVSCRAEGRDVVVWKEDGTVDRVLASEYRGTQLNAPNDLVIAKNGWIYFTDPNFQKQGVMPVSVYSLSPEGELTRICEDIKVPNGIILTPDERTLIINGTFQPEIIAYDVHEDGSVSNRRVYCRVEEPDREKFARRAPDWYGCDGMAMDTAGNLYVTTGAGVQVFDSEGQLIGIIPVPEKPCNAAFGGPENKTLYITAQHSLYSIPCKIPGVIFQQ